MTDPGQRVEQLIGDDTAPEMLEEFRHGLNRPLVTHRADRRGRRFANQAILIVERDDDGVPDGRGNSRLPNAPREGPADHAQRRDPLLRFRGAHECRELGRGLFEQVAQFRSRRVRRQRAKGIERFQPDVRVVVRDGRQQRRHHLRRHVMDAERERAGGKRRFGHHAVSNLEDAADPPLRHDLLGKERVQLRANRLVLDFIVGITDERHERPGRVGMRRILQHEHGTKPRVAIRTSEVGNRGLEWNLRQGGKESAQRSLHAAERHRRAWSGPRQGPMRR